MIIAFWFVLCFVVFVVGVVILVLAIRNEISKKQLK